MALPFASLSLLYASMPLVQAIPRLAFPVNAQIPPLAVVGEQFSFTLSPSTFSHDTPSISYFVFDDIPSWISFDGSLGTFSGTPGTGDVGNFTFTLTANDSTGSAIDNVTFLVVQDDGVTIGQDLISQLDRLGGVDGNGGIVLDNEIPFVWQFAQDTFKTSNHSILTYYAVSTGHTPLPSWIKFSAHNLTFFGDAPEVFSKIAPPQYFTITLIASTHHGFASASQSFDVVIGAHSLTIDPPTRSINTSVSANISYTFPVDTVQLDGRAIGRSNISSITAALGENGNWLTFDNASLLLSGHPAEGDKGTTVTIIVQDVFDDVVHCTIDVALFNGLFATSIPSTMNATIGMEFTFVLNNTLFAVPDVQISVSFSAQGGDNWLTYDSNSRTISGTPAANKATLVLVTITASSTSLSQTQSASFNVQSVSSSGAIEALTSSKSSSNKSLIISLSVILPSLGIAVIVGLIYWYRKHEKSIQSSREPSPLPISRPYITTPDSDWPLEEEKSWGEPRQLGGVDFIKRGMSGMFTLKPPEQTTAATDRQGPSNENLRSVSNIGGPREPPKAARGSWRRSDGRDWVSVARSSDASVATVSTNEIFSVRLVQTLNSSNGRLSFERPGVNGVSPAPGGTETREVAPAANVRPPPVELGGILRQRQDTIGAFSEGSAGAGYEGVQMVSTERMFPSDRGYSGASQRQNDRNSRYSVESFQSGDQREYYENKRGTWYEKRDSSSDSSPDAVEYRVARVSGPLAPMSTNIDWNGQGGRQVPERPRLVGFTKDKKAQDLSSDRGNLGVRFV